MWKSGEAQLFAFSDHCRTANVPSPLAELLARTPSFEAEVFTLTAPSPLASRRNCSPSLVSVEFARLSIVPLAKAVYSADDGLRPVTSFRSDVITLDIGLPQMNGHEVARRLRSGGCTSRILAVSSYGEPEDERDPRKPDSTRIS